MKSLRPIISEIINEVYWQGASERDDTWTPDEATDKILFLFHVRQLQKRKRKR